jgi:hypothetical protein
MTNLTHGRAGRGRRAGAGAVALVALVVGLLALLPAGASASYPTNTKTLDDQIAFGNAIGTGPTSGDPAANFATAKNTLGVGSLRLQALWSSMAAPLSDPNNSCQLKAGANPADPNQYDFSKLTPAVQATANQGMTVLLVFVGGAPCWASRTPTAAACNRIDPNTGKQYSSTTNCTWKPRLDYYDDFVKAVASKVGAAVSRWSPYNEPNVDGFLSGDSPENKALMYRSMWFDAKAAVAPYSNAPLYFGETGTSTTSQDTFFKNALCLNATTDGDSVTPDCGSSPAQVSAELLTFHSYLGTSGTVADPGPLPQDHKVLQTALNADLVNAQNAGRLSTPSWTGVTEFGVHDGYTYMLQGDPTPITDPVGDPSVTEDMRAGYANCAEFTTWKSNKTVRFAQYLLQDPRYPSGGKFHTGLRYAASQTGGGVGTVKDAPWRAYRTPLVVYRRQSDNLLEAWGGYTPNPKPATVTLYGVKASAPTTVVYTKSIALPSSGYYDVTLNDAPAGLKFYSDDGAANQVDRSRTAGGSDCGAGWTGP